MKNTRLSFLMKKNTLLKFFLLSLLLIVIFSLFVFKVNVLQIIDYQEDKLIWQKRAEEGAEFSIKYLHSVARTPVIEFFEIKDGKILLTGTEYESYGAGLPTEAVRGEYLVKDDKFIIKDIDQYLPEILLRVSDYAKHEFIFKENTFPLYKEIKTETLLQIKTEKISYFRFIKRRF
ncbi:uncharacterized protein DUF1850 [Halanaerobium sp. ST460_2HS_T2]|nr:uncharacterized protein DUF1850 [Halanaerobium sp. ST460_2HS_T2]